MKNKFLISLSFLALCLGFAPEESQANIASKNAKKQAPVKKVTASPYTNTATTAPKLESQAVQPLSNSAVATSPATTVLTGQVVSITSGAKTPGRIDRSFSSATSRIGDRGILTLSQSFEGIPTGSQAEFVVSSVTEPKRRFGKSGTIQLKAINIIYPDGSKVALNGEAYIVKADGQTVIEGSTTKERVVKTAGKTAVGGATGALGGLVGSAIGGGNLGRSTAIGSGIGAGIGLATAGLSKGEEVTISSGENLFLNL